MTEVGKLVVAISNVEHFIQIFTSTGVALAHGGYWHNLYLIGII